MKTGVKNSFLLIILLFSISVLPVSSFALSGVAPIQPKKGLAEFSGFLTLGSKIDYEIKGESSNKIDIDIKRDVIGISFASGGHPANIFLSIGIIADGEFSVDDESYDDDSGYSVALGARGKIADLKPITIHAYGQIAVISDEFSGDESRYYDYTIETTTIEMSLGVAGVCQISKELSAYGAIEIIPYSSGDGEIRRRNPYGVRVDADIDEIERDDIFSIKLGAILDTRSLFIRGEFSVGSEEAITISVGRHF